MDPRGRYKNCNYICTRPGSTAIYKANDLLSSQMNSVKYLKNSLYWEEYFQTHSVRPPLHWYQNPRKLSEKNRERKNITVQYHGWPYMQKSSPKYQQSLLIFCLNDVSVYISRVLKSLVTVFMSVLPLHLLIFALCNLGAI